MYLCILPARELKGATSKNASRTVGSPLARLDAILVGLKSSDKGLLSRTKTQFQLSISSPERLLSFEGSLYRSNRLCKSHHRFMIQSNHWLQLGSHRYRNRA
jgi:hypothetical protein